MPGTAIHVRGRDAAKEGFRCPPIEYYRRAIAISTFDCEPEIYTDDLADPIVQILAHDYQITIVHSAPLYDFDAIRRHQHIIIGNSTFAWWAAFLSGHDNVIQPEPTSGWRSLDMPHTCLRVPEWRHIEYDPPNH